MQGSYSCGACRDGYVGDPHSECVRVKFCSGDPKTNPCGRGAECIPTKKGAAFECRVRETVSKFICYYFFSHPVLSFLVLSSPVHVLLCFQGRKRRRNPGNELRFKTCAAQNYGKKSFVAFVCLFVSNCILLFTQRLKLVR